MHLTELIFHTEKAVNDMEAFYGILIPFLGTSLGAACVFFMKKSLSDAVQRSLTGFAAGVMVAASVWSLLIPAIEQSSAMGKLSFCRRFSAFGSAFSFCCCSTTSSRTCTPRAGRSRGRRANSSARR